MTRMVGAITKTLYSGETNVEECTVNLLDDEDVNSARVKKVIKSIQKRCPDCKLCREYRSVSKK